MRVNATSSPFRRHWRQADCNAHFPSPNVNASRRLRTAYRNVHNMCNVMREHSSFLHFDVSRSFRVVKCGHRGNGRFSIGKVLTTSNRLSPSLYHLAPTVKSDQSVRKAGNYLLHARQLFV